MKLHTIAMTSFAATSAAVLLAANLSSAALAQSAARVQIPLTSSDVRTFNDCMAMNYAQMHAHVSCIDIMQKVKLTATDLALIKDCKEQTRDMMVQDKGCMIMNDKYPEILLLK